MNNRVSRKKFTKRKGSGTTISQVIAEGNCYEVNNIPTEIRDRKENDIFSES